MKKNNYLQSAPGAIPALNESLVFSLTYTDLDNYCSLLYQKQKTRKSITQWEIKRREPTLTNHLRIVITILYFWMCFPCFVWADVDWQEAGLENGQTIKPRALTKLNTTQRPEVIQFLWQKNPRESFIRKVLEGIRTVMDEQSCNVVLNYNSEFG